MSVLITSPIVLFPFSAAYLERERLRHHNVVVKQVTVNNMIRTIYQLSQQTTLSASGVLN